MNKVTIIGSDNGLSPSRRQAIIRANAGILLIWTLSFSEILSEIHAFSFKKMYSQMSSAKWRSFCLGFNVLSGKQANMEFPVRQECVIFQLSKLDLYMNMISAYTT